MQFTSGGETYYDHDAALRFMQECEDSGVRILGMEFFRGDERAHTPVSSTAWDELATGPPEESSREARGLLRDGIPDGGNLVVFTTETDE